MVNILFSYKQTRGRYHLKFHISVMHTHTMKAKVEWRLAQALCASDQPLN